MVHANRRHFLEAAFFGPDTMEVVQEKVRGITIDSPRAFDLDDAFWLEGDQAQGWELTVSIAHVGFHVPRDSFVDQQAYRRGFTRYHIQPIRPMMMRRISEERASLLFGTSRPALSFSFSIFPNLQISGPAIRQTQLFNFARLRYADVLRITQDDSHELCRMLRQSGVLAQRLMEARQQKGALAFFRNRDGETWFTSEDGVLKRMSAFEALGHIIVQEFMILVNQAIGSFLAERNVPMIFRNHIARVSAPPRDQVIEDILEAFESPKTYVLETTQERMSLILGKAFYGCELYGHFGLNAPAYAHVTSPIRRYADLVNHRILISTLNWERPPYTISDLGVIAQHLNMVEQRIREERALQVRAREAKKTVAIPVSTEKDIYRFLQSSLVRKIADREFEEQVLAWLHSDKLTPRDLYLILIDSKNVGDVWEALQKEVLQWLMNEPKRVIQFFRYAVTRHNWVVRLNTMPSVREHVPGFLSRVFVERPGASKKMRHVCFSKAREESERLAMLGVLVGICGISDFSVRDVALLQVLFANREFDAVVFPKAGAELVSDLVV